MSVFNLPMIACSSINLFVLLEKSPFNIRQSRSEIEWSGLLKCQVTGSPLLLLRIPSVIVNAVKILHIYHLSSYLGHISCILLNR